MKELFGKLSEWLNNNQDAVLASIVASSGSTPRGIGAHMLVAKNKRTLGTVGGGAIELKSQEIAMAVLENKKSRLEKFRLSSSEIADLGMICGGNVTVYFKYFSCDEKNKVFVNEVLNAFKKGENCWLAIEMSESADAEILIKQDNHMENENFYMEQIISKSRIYIFGGGHVGQKLSTVLGNLGYRHTVVDDRAEFCNKELFPFADDVILTDITNLGNIKISNNDFVVIVTRGHQHDFHVLSWSMKTEAPYIGMIGSRGKIAKTYDKLYKLGFSKEDTARIHSPIGLEIYAETPEEIAISIAAEIIKEKATLKKNQMMEA